MTNPESPDKGGAHDPTQQAAEIFGNVLDAINAGADQVDADSESLKSDIEAAEKAQEKRRENLESEHARTRSNLSRRWKRY